MQKRTTRRDILRSSSALATLSLAGPLAATPGLRVDDYVGPMTARNPHLPGKAKSVIFLFMYGGPSHVDTFDYKPDLYPLDGKTIQVKTRGRGGAKNQGRVVGPKWSFKRYGECGKHVSSLFPHLGQHVARPACEHGAERVLVLGEDLERDVAQARRVGPVRTQELERGGALLGIHTASICFSDWPEWSSLLGGRWVWGNSWHPPPEAITVTPNEDGALAHLPPFEVQDELYSDLLLEPGAQVLAHGLCATVPTPQPIVWSHTVGAGRVIYDALGHDSQSIYHSPHAQLLCETVKWALDGADMK